MSFINKIKNLTEINEVLSKTDLGNISKIRNNREMVVKYLTSFNYEGELIDIINMADDRFYELFNKNEKFKAGLKHKFGNAFIETSTNKRIDYANELQKESIINFDGKRIDLKNISNEEYANLLKNKNFSQALVKNFKDKSSYRQIVLGKHENVKDKGANRLSLKSFLLNKNKIYSLMTSLNNGKFKRTLVMDLDTRRLDNDINKIELKVDIEKCNEILKKYEYNKPMYEIGICYDKNKNLVSLQEALRTIRRSLETDLQDKAKLEDYNAIEKIFNNLKNIYDNQYKVIFSIEPLLAVSQSSSVDWKSCMTLIDDQYGLKQKASSSINAGLAVVYITKVGDLAIDRPLARFLIKVASLPGFENRKEEKYHQFHVERMYTSSNQRPHITVPQREEDTDSVLNKFGLKVKAIVDNINKPRLKNLIDTLNKVQANQYDGNDLNDEEKQKMTKINPSEISFDMSDDYYSDSGRTVTRVAAFDFIEIAERGEDFTEQKITSLINALKGNRLSIEYLDNLMNLLIKNSKYKNLIRTIVDTASDKRSGANYIIRLDYSQENDGNISAYGDHIVLPSRASGKENVDITANMVSYYARNIQLGKNNLKSLEKYNINYKYTKYSNQTSSKTGIGINRQDVLFLYKYNTYDKGSFTIGDHIKFSDEINKQINNRQDSELTKIIKRNDKTKEEKLKITLKDSNSFTKKYVFSPVAVKIPDKEKFLPDGPNQLEVKFDKDFNRNLEYDFKNCVLKFDKKTELKDNKNFKLFFKGDKNKIAMYPDNFYITVNVDDAKENQVKANYKLLKENVESNQLKQIKSNQDLLNILKNKEIIEETNGEIKFVDSENLNITPGLLVNEIDVFTKYKFLQLSQATLPKNIYFVFDIVSDTNQYPEAEIKYMEKIINFCKIFNINYFVTLNGQEEKIETSNDFSVAVFKYSIKNYEIVEGVLKIYEKNKKTDYDGIVDAIKTEGARDIELLRLEGADFDLSKISDKYDKFNELRFFDIPKNFTINVKKYEVDLKFIDFNNENLTLNIEGRSSTQHVRVIIENSNIKNLKILGENISVKVIKSNVSISGESKISGYNNFYYQESNFLADSNLKVDKIKIVGVDQIDIPKKFTFTSFEADSVGRINNYENVNWDNLFNYAMHNYPEFKVNLKDYSNFPLFIEKEKMPDIENIIKNKSTIISVTSGGSAEVKFNKNSMEAMLKNALDLANIKPINQTKTFKEDAAKFHKLYYALPYRMDDTGPFLKFYNQYGDIKNKSQEKRRRKRLEIISKNPLKTKVRNIVRAITGKKKKLKPLNDSFISSIKRIDSKTYFD